MTVYTQDANATLTWLHDWTARLARAETDLGLTAGSLTITAATVTAPTGVTASGAAPNAGGTGVTFHLSTTLTAPTDQTLTTRATLSNGDVDEAELVIGFR